MKVIYHYASALTLPFLFVYALTPFIIRLAVATNFMDNPEARKVHKKATPLMGGVAVFTGFILFAVYHIALCSERAFNLPVIGYLGGALIITLVGLIDDRYTMSPKVKMLGQLAACVVFIVSQQLYYGNFLNMFLSPWLSVPIMIFWMIGLMNALNFLDNMDGIISGMSGILAIGFYVLSVSIKTSSLAPQTNFIGLMSLTFAGAIFGFLPHNFRPAKIFLGDAGSMFIGYFLSTMGILSGRLAVIHRSSEIYYLLPVLMLSYAIFDISLVSITRKRDGRRITQGGKDHSTHRIDNAMGSARVTALIIYLINAIIVICSILIYRMNSIILLIASTALFAAFFLFFGRKLDQIPVMIPANQVKHKEVKA